jgi:hypothetical protein
MKTKCTVHDAANRIREAVLALPSAERSRLCNELLPFLLAQALPEKSGGKAPDASNTPLTEEQRKLIRELGEQTARLNDLMDGDPYFFM